MARWFSCVIAPSFLVALAGCKLIDQTTFAPDPGPGQAAIASSTLPRGSRDVPLVSIRYETSTPAYRDQLSLAVRAAEERRPGSDYHIIGVSTAADAAQTGRDSADVMAALMDLGIVQARIHLGARIDPAQMARIVHVYLQRK